MLEANTPPATTAVLASEASDAPVQAPKKTAKEQANLDDGAAGLVQAARRRLQF